jgi:hypothetical protein
LEQLNVEKKLKKRRRKDMRIRKSFFDVFFLQLFEIERYTLELYLMGRASLGPAYGFAAKVNSMYFLVHIQGRALVSLSFAVYIRLGIGTKCKSRND